MPPGAARWPATAAGSRPGGSPPRIEADRTGVTAVPGVWVAGNIADIQAQVVSSAAAGLTAAAAINFDLVLEETRKAAGRRLERLAFEPSFGDGPAAQHQG